MPDDSLVFQGLDDRRRDLERHKENSSRMAEVHGRFQSNGMGSIEFETRVDFGVTFIEEPCVSYGAQIDVDELQRTLEAIDTLPIYMEDILFPTGHDGTPAFPLTSGYVTDWDIDNRGYFTGAWCGVRVYYPLAVDIGEGGFRQYEITAPVEVIHHFRFSAIGMKDVPTELTD